MEIVVNLAYTPKEIKNYTMGYIMALFLRGNNWSYDFTVNGKRYQGSTGLPASQRKKAQEKVDALKIQYKEGRSVEMIWEQTKRTLIKSNNVPLKYEDVWHIFSKKAMLSASRRRIMLYSSHVRAFCVWMKKEYPNIQTVAQITDDCAKEYINQLRRLNGANSTKNDKLATLKMLFETLGNSAGVIKNPFGDIKKLSMNKISRDAFTIEELKLIGEKATGWIYSLCLTALSTGLREGDICLLKKTSVNLKTGWISIQKIQKTGKPLEIPIMPKLAEHIAESMKGNDSEYIFPELATIYLKNATQIGTKVKNFFQEIGIIDARKRIDGYAKQLSSKDIHSFRHTFVYLAALHNIPFPIVQSIVGHGSPAMTKIYMNHAGREAKTKYFSQLPEYLSGDTQIKAEKTITPERMLRIIKRITPASFEKNKARIIALLS